MVVFTFPLGGGIILSALLVAWGGYSTQAVTSTGAVVFGVFMLMDRLISWRWLKTVGGVLILIALSAMASAQLIAYDWLTANHLIYWAIGPTLLTLYLFLRTHLSKTA